jgi:hypothetical protein
MATCTVQRCTLTYEGDIHTLNGSPISGGLNLDQCHLVDVSYSSGQISFADCPSILSFTSQNWKQEWEQRLLSFSSKVLYGSILVNVVGFHGEGFSFILTKTGLVACKSYISPPRLQAEKRHRVVKIDDETKNIPVYTTSIYYRQDKQDPTLRFMLEGVSQLPCYRMRTPVSLAHTSLQSFLVRMVRHLFSHGHVCVCVFDWNKGGSQEAMHDNCARETLFCLHDIHNTTVTHRILTPSRVQLVRAAENNNTNNRRHHHHHAQ